MPHPEQSNYQTSGIYSAADLTSLVELQTEAESLYTKKELQTALSEYYKTRDVTPCGDVPPFFPVWYMAVDQEQDALADELYERMTMSENGYGYVSPPSSTTVTAPQC